MQNSTVLTQLRRENRSIATSSTTYHLTTQFSAFRMDASHHATHSTPITLRTAMTSSTTNMPTEQSSITFLLTGVTVTSTTPNQYELRENTGLDVVPDLITTKH